MLDITEFLTLLSVGHCLVLDTTDHECWTLLSECWTLLSVGHDRVLDKRTLKKHGFLNRWQKLDVSW